MAAKELKALVDIGTSLGYTGEDHEAVAE